MRTTLLMLGILFSVGLSLFVGYRQGVQDGFQYTEKVKDADHATGLMRARYDSAFESYACFLKLRDAEANGSLAIIKEEVKESALYSINGFREQVERIRIANINYPLVEIYEPQINKMEIELIE